MMKKSSLTYKIIKDYYPFFIIFLGCFTGHLNWKTVFLIYICYCTYVNHSSKTMFFYKETQKNKKILASSSFLKDTNFKPHFLIPNSFIQLLFFTFISNTPEKLSFDEKENVNEFGSTLSWVSIKNDKKETFTTIEDKNRPILIILPGITGDDSDIYINKISYKAIKNNYKVVVYNNRLLSDQIVLHPEIHLDLIEEFDCAVSYIEKNYPNRKLYAIGFSYGANKLLKFLGTKNLNKKGKNRILAGVSVSNPFDLKLCQRFLHENIYDNLILNFLKKKLRKNYNSVKKFETYFDLEIDQALQAQSLIEYDEHIIRRVLRYKTPDHYYHGMSCVNHLSEIKVPTLCINALDDNITTPLAIPYDEIKSNENMILMTTDRGGHLVWIDNSSILKLEQWVNEPIIDYLNTIRKLNL